MAYDIGPVIGIEGEAEFRQAIRGINTNLRTLGTEMLAVTSQFEKNDKSMEALTSQNKVLNKQIDEQKTKLSELQKGLQAAAEKYGENDKVTQGWQQAVNKATADLNKMERELKNNQNEIDNFGKEIKETSKETDNFNSKLSLLGAGLINVGKFAGTAVVTGIKALGASMVAATAGIVGATEATKEYRSDLSKLEQNATTAGNSFDVMKDKLSELNALTGETDSSIEALSNLMAAGLDDNQLVQAVDALSGAVIKFPDTLKIEGLADGLQETLATGQAIGPFAELLERSGVDLEAFNLKMSKATTEAEKQQLALDWLANSGLAQINKQYKENNKNMLAAEEAQFRLNDAIADFAKITEPSIATLKTGLADIVTNLIEVVKGSEGATQGFSKSINDFIGNILNSFTTMIPTIATTLQSLIPVIVSGLIEALPTVVNAIGDISKTIIGTFTTLIPQLLPVGIGILKTLIDGIVSSLPTLIPTVFSIITGISDTIISNIGNVVDIGINILLALVQGIVNSLPSLIQEVPRVINEFSSALYAQLPKLLKAGVDILLMLGKGIIDSIPTLIANIPQIIMAIVNVITLYNWWNLGSSVITKIGDGIKGMTGNIGSTAKGLAEWVGTTITNIFKGGLDWGKGLITNIGSGFSSMLSYITTSISSLATSVLGAIKGIFTGGFDIGKNLIQGLWNGVLSLKDWVLGKIGEFASSILGVFTDKWQIASPSKVTTLFGQYLDEGLAKGIEENAGKPISSATILVNAIGTALDKVNNFVTNTVSIVKKEFELWKLQNVNLAGSSKELEMQLEAQRQEHELLTEQIKVTESALADIVAKYGEGSEQALKYKNELLGLQIEQSKLTGSIEETTAALKNMASAQTMKSIDNYNKLSDNEKSEKQKSYKEKEVNFEKTYEKEIKAYSKLYNVDLGVAKEILKKDLPGYASGTDFHPGGLAWVGERGRELVELPRGSKVFTNQQSENMMKQASRPINLNLNIGTYIGNDHSLKQLKRMLNKIEIVENGRLGVSTG